MENNAHESEIKAELLGSFGSDRDIANAAWTSSLEQQKKDQRSDEEVAKVVRYLISNRHSSPIEQVAYRFYIKMPIFVSRQFMRHRLQSPNEMSGRYRTMLDDFLSIPSDVEQIAAKTSDKNLSADWEKMHKEEYLFYQQRLDHYKQAEADGKITNDEYKRVREIMRGVLGTSFFTQVTTVFNLRSLANFFKLRLDPHAQPEIRELARQMLECVEKDGSCPVAIQCLKENNWEI
ncbi:MAG: FAD-dependent thymidylate synthase [Candidatus Margulisiibacteriota bacterium]|jgi:thymidylate synthase (FAD)